AGFQMAADAAQDLRPLAIAQGDVVQANQVACPPGGGAVPGATARRRRLTDPPALDSKRRAGTTRRQAVRTMRAAITAPGLLSRESQSYKGFARLEPVIEPLDGPSRPAHGNRLPQLCEALPRAGGE